MCQQVLMPDYQTLIPKTTTPTPETPRAQGDIAVSADVAEGPSGRTLDWKRTQNETFIVPSQFLLALITLPANHLNSHGTLKGSLGDLELAFDRFRDVLHERLGIKHKLGMWFVQLWPEPVAAYGYGIIRV